MIRWIIIHAVAILIGVLVGYAVMTIIINQYL